MAGPNEVEVDFVPIDQGMAAELEKFSSVLKIILNDVVKTRVEFSNISKEISKYPDIKADLAKKIAAATAAGDADAVKALSAQVTAAAAKLKQDTDKINAAQAALERNAQSRAQAADTLQNATLSPGGRSLGDAQLRNQAVGLVTAALNTDDAQMSARIADAAAKAAERLLKTAERSLIARFNQVGVTEQIRQETFTNPAAIQAMVTRARIGTEKLVRDYGADAPQTLAAREAMAAREANERTAALRQRQTAELENRSFDQTRSGDAAAREVARDIGFANRYGVDRASFQQRVKDESLSLADQRVALSELAAQRKTALAQSAQQEAEAYALNRTFDAQRKKRLDAEAASLRTQADNANRLFDERKKQLALNLRNEAEGENRRLTPETALRTVKRDRAFENLTGVSRSDFSNIIKDENLDLKAQEVRLSALIDKQTKLNAAKKNQPKPEKSAEEIAAERAARRQANNESLDDRLSENGGATFFGFQARIAANYAIFGAAVASVRSAMGAIVEFDDVLKKFQAITDTTNTEMKTFRGELLGIAADSKFSVTEIGQVAIQLGQTGLAAAEVAKALKPVINLATASGSSLQEAVEAVTGVLGAYALEAGRAGDVSDVFVGALNRTRLTMGQLQLGIQYAANIARDSGVSFSELTATIGSIAQAGVKSGSTIGTGVRQLLTELSSPTEKFRTVLRELGISLADVDLKTNGLSGVLENLRDKGFTTADALRSLDLRAAAAFSALAGQGNRIKTLQQELLLSSAAAEASTKANESLAAGFQRFQNSAFAVVDKALSPMVEALKSATGGAAALFQGLSQLGPILPVIGTGLAAVAASAAALKVAGLAGGVLNNLVSGAALGLTGPLGAALKGGTAITALIAGGALVSYLELLESRAEKATKRLDELKAAENSVTGRITAVDTNTNAIDAQILQLIDRREKLNNDPILRRTAVIEAQKAFGELGLTISSSISNIDDLVEALQRLRTGLNQSGPSLLLEQLALLRKETEQLKILQEEQAKKNRPQAENIGDDPLSQSVDPLQRFNVLRGNAFDRAREVVQDPSKFGEDANQTAGKIFGGISEAIVFANSQRAKAILEGNTQEMKLQDERISLLLDLNKLVKQALDTQNNINAKNMQIERVNNSAAARSIAALPEIDNVQKGVESIYGQRDISQARILNDKTMTDLQKRDALTESLQVARQAGDLQLALLDDMAARLKSEGVPKEVIEEALAPIRNRIADVSKGVTEPLRQIYDAVSGGARAALESAKRGTQLQIENALKAAGTARDMVSVDAADAEVRALVERQSKIVTQLAELQVVNPDDLKNNPILMDKLNQDQENLRTQLAGYAEKISAAKRRIQEQLLQYRDIADSAQKDRLTKEATRLQKILEDANTTPEKARELVEEINRLLTEAANIAKRMNATDMERKLQSAPSDTGTAIPGAGAAEGSVAKQIIDAANARGADAGMTRYLLALGQLESGQNGSRTSSAGAAGVFQFMPETWRTSGGGNIRDTADQTRNAIQFTNENDAIFRARFGRDPTGEERFVLHNQGGQGGPALIEAAMEGRSARSALSSAAITNQQPEGRKDDTVSAQEFLEYLKNMFRSAFSKTEGQATSASGIIRQARQDQDAAVDERLQQDREKSQRRIEDKERTVDLFRLRALDREDDARFQGEAQMVRRAVNPTDAMDANRRALQTLAELRGNALTRDEVQNRGRSPEQSGEDQAAISTGFRQRAETQAVAAAEAVGKVALKVYDDQLETLQARLKDLKRDSSEGKYNADELNALNAQIEALQKKKELQGQLESYDAQILSLRQSITQIEDSGLGSRKDLLRITTELEALERKRAQVAPTVAQARATERSEPTVENSLSLGRDDFLKSRGITNNLGELVSSTQLARKNLASDLAVIGNGFDTLFTNLFNGSMKAGDALKKFATDILSGLMSQASRSLTNSIFAALLGPSAGGSGGSASSLIGSIGSFLGSGSFIGFANGGMPVPAAGMASGGEVTGGVANRDSVTRRLMPGEYVLRRSAVQGIGRENVERMNAMGNAMVSKAPPMSIAGLGGSSARATSNVFVIPPEAKPPPSANDIVYTIANDIQTGGNLRKLIKSVTAGHDG